MKTTARLFGLSLIALVTVSLLPGCGGKKEVTPVAVGEMQEYRDPMYGFRFHFPKGWTQTGEAGRPRVLNTADADQRFRDPLGAYPDGVVFTVEVKKTATPADDIKKAVDEMKSIGMIVGEQSAVTFGGKPATRVPYVANYSQNVRITGYHLFVNLDTAMIDAGAAGFGDLYAAHVNVFDAIAKSFEFAKPVEKGRDQTLPSDATTDYATQFFSFQYPENFNFESVPKGSNDLALSLRGANKSTAIQFTVFGAKGLTVEKVFDQNKGKFPGGIPGQATVGGEAAKMITYMASKDVERRFYFVVKNDKVIRITLDWVKPQRTDYLAAYDKVINSIKFK